MNINRAIQLAITSWLLLSTGFALAQAMTMDSGQTPSITMEGMSMEKMPAHGNAAHGDHMPKFGGLVLMYGVLHFEIVADAEAGLLLHLIDAMRTPMPAVTVSDVTIEVERANQKVENIAMRISDAGDFWSGLSKPLGDAESTTVHLAFVAFGNPYVYALPLTAIWPESPLAQGQNQPSTNASHSDGSHVR